MQPVIHLNEDGERQIKNECDGRSSCLIGRDRSSTPGSEGIEHAKFWKDADLCCPDWRAECANGADSQSYDYIRRAA
jgi:hypothetical protein